MRLPKGMGKKFSLVENCNILCVRCPGPVPPIYFSSFSCSLVGPIRNEPAKISRCNVIIVKPITTNAVGNLPCNGARLVTTAISTERDSLEPNATATGTVALRPIFFSPVDGSRRRDQPISGHLGSDVFRKERCWLACTGYATERDQSAAFAFVMR